MDKDSITDEGNSVGTSNGAIYIGRAPASTGKGVTWAILVALAVVTAACGGNSRTTSIPSEPHPTETRTALTPAAANPYEGLRSQVLHLDPAEIGLAPTAQRANVWGVLMEMGMLNGVATLVALGDGTVSLYTSTGGGVIGGGEHDAVRAAGSLLLDTAEANLDATAPTENTPLPASGRLRFYVLTFSGIRTVELDQSEAARDTNPMHSLFGAGQDVLTAVRQVSP